MSRNVVEAHAKVRDCSAERLEEQAGLLRVGT